MVHAQKIKFYFTALATLLFLLAGQTFAQQDPPSRVARLNYVNGNVSMEPAGVDDWAPADVNRPFTIGDYLFADQNSQAELHLDTAVIRIGAQTSFGFLNLDDQTVQLKLTEGDMYVTVRNFGSGQVFEVDTPNVAVNLMQDGIYRFRVDANGNMSFVVVRQGQAQITGGGQAFTLNADNSATLTGTDQISYDIELAPQPDEFDQWSQQRDTHEQQREAARYVSPNVVGYEDLDDYGNWQNTGEYGAVWYPTNVASGWAPYHNGHWAWIDPWGWTWIDSMPWGFAPFHYGRWAYIGNRWGWCPGPLAGGRAVRPYYAPAMVAWFGGSNWRVGVTSGGPSLGWVPLGWGEVYTPSYRCSPRYFNNVNVYNTRVVKTVNITNVYNTVYVKKTVYNQQFVNVRAPNAVMAMPQSAFANGRLVSQAAQPVSQANLATVHTAAVVAPPVAPTRQSVLATATTRAASRPSPQVINRQVVARNTPPPRPASFATSQQNLQQHAGQPVVVAAARPVEANVRKAPPATPVAVRPGERHGNTAAAVGGNQPPPEPVAQPAEPAIRPGEPAARTNEPAHPLNQPPARSGQPIPQANEAAGQPATAQTPPPRAHGVPPNMRHDNPPPAPNQRYSVPATQPAPVTRVPQSPQTQQPQPAAERPPAAVRPTPQYEPQPPAAQHPETAPPRAPQEQRPQPAERPAPAARPAPQDEPAQPPSERRPTPPRPSTQEESRQPAPERPPAATRPAPQYERPQSAERPAAAPPPSTSGDRGQPRPEANPNRSQSQEQRSTQPPPERHATPPQNPQQPQHSQPEHQPPPKNDKNNNKPQ